MSSRSGLLALAAALVHQVTIETGGTIGAEGLKRRNRESWSVSYRLMVPRSSNLELESANGEPQLEPGVSGQVAGLWEAVCGVPGP